MLLITFKTTTGPGKRWSPSCALAVPYKEGSVMFATRLDLDDALSRIRLYQEAFGEGTGHYVSLTHKLVQISEVEELSRLNRDYFGILLVENLPDSPAGLQSVVTETIRPTEAKPC